MVDLRSTRHYDAALLVLRIGIGAMFALAHGWDKITAGPETWTKLGGAMGALGITFAPAFWGFMAAFAEFVGGILLAIGLFFRPAAILLLITMAVAAIMHLSAGHGLGKASHAIEAGVVFIALLISGPGRMSLKQSIPFCKRHWFG
jgi:putative oxidoreductase